MAKQSAGILAYRFREKLEVFLVHPGGPFFKNKDVGAWSVPKGEYTCDEDALRAAQREFMEETGHKLTGSFIPLIPVKQKAGKVVTAWAIEQDIDAENIVSNMFEIEWPPKSGNIKLFPEIDNAQWFSIDEAKAKINVAQVSFIDQLVNIINQ